jgi:hypothetical protein
MNVLTAFGSVDGEVAGRRKYSDSVESLEGLWTVRVSERWKETDLVLSEWTHTFK